jgi:hypothetical protein
VSADPESLAGYLGQFPDGTPDRSFSTVRENLHVVSMGACRLFGFNGYSNRGSSQFILVFDTGQIPANGALPIFPIFVGATANFSAYYGSVGRWFERGCVLANSSTDNLLTLGSADCWFDAQYI